MKPSSPPKYPKQTDRAPDDTQLRQIACPTVTTTVRRVTGRTRITPPRKPYKRRPYMSFERNVQYSPCTRRRESKPSCNARICTGFWRRRHARGSMAKWSARYCRFSHISKSAMPRKPVWADVLRRRPFYTLRVKPCREVRCVRGTALTRQNPLMQKSPRVSLPSVHTQGGWLSTISIPIFQCLYIYIYTYTYTSTYMYMYMHIWIYSFCEHIHCGTRSYKKRRLQKNRVYLEAPPASQTIRGKVLR